MTWLLVAAGIALLVPLLTRGSYLRLLNTSFQHGALLLGGLALQMGLEWAPLPEARRADVGLGLLVASYVLILGFAAGNLVRRGMVIVLLGLACNAVVIVANQGMPVDLPPDWEADGRFEATVKHRPQEPNDRLLWLSDIIVLREPFDTVLSFGDLIMAAGLLNVTFAASRRPRRRPAKSASAQRQAPEMIDLTRPDPGPDERRDGHASRRRRRRGGVRAHPANGFAGSADPLRGQVRDRNGHAVRDDSLERVEDPAVVRVARR